MNTRIARPATQSNPESFTGGRLTILGGAGLWRRMIESLKVEEELERHVPSFHQGKAYTDIGLLMCGIWAHVVQLGRPYLAEMLSWDRAFLTLAGMSRFPSQSTVSRMLSRVKMSIGIGILAANKALLLKVRRFGEMRVVTLDLDTHVMICYGGQERAAKGYNPKKPGRKAYHPMFCFIGETRDVLHARMRGGKDSHIGKDESVEFLRESIKGIPIKKCKIRVRADSAFYSKRFFEYLEKKGTDYAIVVRMYAPIQHHLPGLQYKDMGGGLEVAEFFYKAGDWKQSRRIVVIRQRIKEGEKRGKQLKLLECDGYSYQAIITNLTIPAYEVWKFYNGRCSSENMIKEGVYDFGWNEAVSHKYAGNACWLYLAVLAYNITNWVKDIGFGGGGPKRFARYFRERFLRIAGRMAISGRQWQLRLSSAHPYQDEFWEAVRRIGEFAPVC